MFTIGPSLLAIVLAQTSLAARAERVPRDTGAVARDTVSAARITLDLGAGPIAPFAASMIDLSVGASQATPKAPPVATVQFRFQRAPDTLSAELANLIGTGHLTSVEAVLPAHGTTPPITLRLYDVQVTSMRLVSNEDNVGLVQQRLGLQESIGQLSIDLAEAQRQLVVTESLDKRKLSSPLEVSHAHATADAISARLAVQRQHLALVEQLLSRWTPVREEIVLTANRMDMQAR
jgi:hypothetical protein